jgi:hypothetical protein
VVTLAAMVAAWVGHAAYCEKQASVHEREYNALGARLCPTGPSVYANSEEISHDRKLIRHHGRLVDAYRKAAWRPWVVVRETPLPNSAAIEVTENPPKSSALPQIGLNRDP